MPPHCFAVAFHSCKIEGTETSYVRIPKFQYFKLISKSKSSRQKTPRSKCEIDNRDPLRSHCDGALNGGAKRNGAAGFGKGRPKGARSPLEEGRPNHATNVLTFYFQLRC